jgi:hypothetical protein
VPPEGDRMETIMKRKAKKSFISIFFKSLILVLLLVTAGILTYSVVMLYWQPKGNKGTTAYQENTKAKKVVAIGSDDISKNLIYSYNKKTNEIEAVLLELLNCDNNKLTYLTLPVKTQLTMSPLLYQKMVVLNPEIPQMMALSAIPKYFDFNKSAEDSIRIVEEMLATKINYYTVIPSDTFDEMYTTKDIQQNDGNDVVPQYVFRWSYRKTFRNIDSQDKLKNYIKENYSDVKSDLPLKGKLSLAKYYSKIKSNDLRYELLKGSNLNRGYVIDPKLVQQQLQELLAN